MSNILNTSYKVQVDILDTEVNKSIEKGTLFLIDGVLRLQLDNESTPLLTEATEGVITLDEFGKIPSEYLPAFVDDVLEYADFASLPVTGATGVIYVTTDNNTSYRWTGGAYVTIGGSIISVNGYTGVVVLTKADVGLSNVDNTSDLNKPISTATQTALDDKVDKVVGKQLTDVNFTVALKTSYDQAVTDSHTHANKALLDSIQEAFTTVLKGNYDTAFANSHTHPNKAILDAIQEAFTTAMKTKLDGIAPNANNYTHPNHSGDVTSVGDGSTTISNNAVTNAKLADVAVNTIKGRITAGTGDPEDLTAGQVKTILGISGTNTGDQTSIVGISGTKAQFDTALTDGNFLYVGDVSVTDETVKVSANDTTAGYLNGKLVEGNFIDLIENNNGANETLSVALNGDLISLIQENIGTAWSSGMEVTANSPADQAVDISAGSYYIQGVKYLHAGTLNFSFTADFTALTSGQHRIATLYIDNTNIIQRVLGSATSGNNKAIPPSIPANSICLAEIELIKNQNNITTVDIKDCRQTLSSSDVAPDEAVKVSLNDTTAGYLNGKLVAGSGITLTENNDGANETLTISAASSVSKLEREFVATAATVVAKNAQVNLTGTLANANDTVAKYTSITTTTVAGNSAVIRDGGLADHRTSYNPTLEVYIKPTTLTAQRIFVGFATAVPTNADDPGSNYIYFRHSTVAGDTGWRPITDNGTTQTVGANIGTVVAGTLYKLKIRVTATEVFFSVNDGAEQMINTTIPANTVNFGFVCAIITTATGAKTLAFNRAKITSDY